MGVIDQTASWRNSIVVTGATGFLGGELLLRLLDQTGPNQPIICPVRASCADAARQRGAETLTALLGRAPTTTQSQRITWVRGDLEQPRLGWGREQWDAVAGQVAEIFHCAASVSFDLPVAEAHRINVDGTSHVFELALHAQSQHGRFRRFHHVSTAYVAGRSAAVVDSDFLPCDSASNYRNTYERTKARAERFLRSQSRVPVSIYRPSIVGGSTLSGRTTNWNVLYVPMKMLVRGQLPIFLSGGRSIVDSVGVDFVVDAMTALRTIEGDEFRSYHLTAGPTAFDVKGLLNRTHDLARKRPEYRPSATKFLSPRSWTALATSASVAAHAPAAFGNVRRKGRLMHRGLSACAVYVPYTLVDTVYSAGREHDVLRSFGVVMPDSTVYLDRIVEYALDHNFGRIPDTTYQWSSPGSTHDRPWSDERRLVSAGEVVA